MNKLALVMLTGAFISLATCDKERKDGKPDLPRATSQAPKPEPTIASLVAAPLPTSNIAKRYRLDWLPNTCAELLKICKTHKDPTDCYSSVSAFTGSGVAVGGGTIGQHSQSGSACEAGVAYQTQQHIGYLNRDKARLHIPTTHNLFKKLNITTALSEKSGNSSELRNLIHEWKTLDQRIVSWGKTGKSQAVILEYWHELNNLRTGHSNTQCSYIYAQMDGERFTRVIMSAPLRSNCSIDTSTMPLGPESIRYWEGGMSFRQFLGRIGYEGTTKHIRRFY